MSRGVRIVLLVNLLVLACLAFVYPHLMVAPGKLIAGHDGMEADCFACHAPFFGASNDRCTACHKPAEIGKLTSRGQPIEKPLARVAFHQGLLKQDCLACHGDHAGAQRFRAGSRFSHDLLNADARRDCLSCHKAPGDALHREIKGNCSQCHSMQSWLPANFDHDRYFALDRDHRVKCATCHVRNEYSAYTCYGCHEHSAEKIRREHVKEGIRDYRNCVECHRNADEHDIRMPGGRSENRRESRRDGRREHHGREHDDD